MELTADREKFVDVGQLPESHEFFRYQELVNKNTRAVPSHAVIRDYISKNKKDYRSEDSPNPVKALTSRTKDETGLGRKASS